VPSPLEPVPGAAQPKPNVRKTLDTTRESGVTRTRSSAATVLAASDEVEKAAARLRREVEEFLGTVAA